MPSIKVIKYLEPLRESRGPTISEWTIFNNSCALLALDENFFLLYLPYRQFSQIGRWFKSLLMKSILPSIFFSSFIFCILIWPSFLCHIWIFSFLFDTYIAKALSHTRCWSILTPKVLWWFQAQNCLITPLLKSSYSFYFFEFFSWIQP
jgi:hypothetical protein